MSIVNDLVRQLESALRYIEVQNAYNGAMTAAEVEQAIKNNKTSVAQILANSVTTLASFSFDKTRDVLARVKSQTDDITIHWGNRASYNRHKVAIDVQDAGNLRALAREFVKVVDQASDETGSTKATWEDPAVVLFVNKFESLCHSERRFSDAYKACQEKVPA